MRSIFKERKRTSINVIHNPVIVPRDKVNARDAHLVRTLKFLHVSQNWLHCSVTCHYYMNHAPLFHLLLSEY